MIVTVDEDPAVVKQLDEQARREGTSRSTLVRRAIRQMLFGLTTIPEIGNNPKNDHQQTATA